MYLMLLCIFFVAKNDPPPRNQWGKVGQDVPWLSLRPIPGKYKALAFRSCSDTFSHHLPMFTYKISLSVCLKIRYPKIVCVCVSLALPKIVCFVITLSSLKPKCINMLGLGIYPVFGQTHVPYKRCMAKHHLDAHATQASHQHWLWKGLEDSCHLEIASASTTRSEPSIPTRAPLFKMAKGQIWRPTHVLVYLVSQPIKRLDLSVAQLRTVPHRDL